MSKNKKYLNTNNTNSKHCCWCYGDIHEKAVVCTHCSRHQHSLIYGIQYVGVAVSVILMLVAIGQFYLASSETKEAVSANKSAKLALIKATKAAQIQRTVTTNFIDQLVNLQSDIVKTTENQIVIFSSQEQKAPDEDTKDYMTFTKHRLMEQLEIADARSDKIQQFKREISQLYEIPTEDSDGGE